MGMPLRVVGLLLAVLPVAAARAVAYGPGDVLVADRYRGSIRVFDADLHYRGLLNNDPGLLLVGMDLLPNGNVLAVSWGDPFIHTYSPAGTLTSQLQLGFNLWGIDDKQAPDGSILVSTQAPGGALQLDAQGNVLGSFNAPGLDDSEALAVVGHEVWIGEGQNEPIRVFDLATRTLLRTIPLDGGQLAADAMQYSPATHSVLIADSAAGAGFERDAVTGALLHVFATTDLPGSARADEPNSVVGPLGITRMADGDVLVASPDRLGVFRFAADGTFRDFTAMAQQVSSIYNIIAVPIPEPGMAALVLSASAIALARRRR